MAVDNCYVIIQNSKHLRMQLPGRNRRSTPNRVANVTEVIVETNWVVDVALQQEEASVELFDQAQAGHVRLFVPTFCIAEATKNVELKQAELRRILADQLPRLRHELSRSPVTRDSGVPIDQLIVALAAAHDSMTAAFWPRLREIVGLVTLLHPRPETIDLTATVYDSLKLSPADASVLASVILASREHTCRAFMSRDADFSQTAVKEHLAAEGIQFYGSALPIVGPLRKQ